MPQLFVIKRAPLDKPIAESPLCILIYADKDASDFNEFLLTNGYTFSVFTKIPTHVHMYVPASLDGAIYTVLGYRVTPNKVIFDESNTDQPLRPSDA